MNRYVRLGYIVPRLVLLVLIVVTLEVGSGWLMRRVVIDAGQGALGARVELDKARVSLLDTRVTLRGLRVANPSRPMENLFEAERMELDFETGEVLRRRAVVEEGAVHGLRFGTTRETSGLLESELSEESASTAPAWVPESASDLASDAARLWIDDLQQRLLSNSADRFESVRLARGLSESWPKRYASIHASADELRSDVKLLRDQAREAKRNPLRNAELIKTLPTRAEGLQRRWERLDEELKSLPAELAADRRRVQQARIEDERMIRESLAVGDLDAESLTSYLLGDQVTGSVRELVGWAKWARQMMPSKQPPKQATPRARGIDVHFAGVSRRPDLLVRSLLLRGEARMGGRSVEMTGRVTDFTTSPRLHDDPMRVAVKTGGPTPLDVTATLDRTGDTPHDTLRVVCDAFDIPGAELGQPDRFVLAMAPASGRLNIDLKIEGDTLAGELLLEQQRVRFDARFQGGAVADRLQQAIGQRLARLDGASTSVKLSGTLDAPKLRLGSTLGPALASAVSESVREVGKAEAQRLLAEADQRVGQRLAALDEVAGAGSRLLSEDLAGPLREVQALAGGWFSPGLTSFERLGEQAGSLFK